jgi:hypothetical protein
MNGTSVIGWVALPNPGPTWHVIGSGDFNGDGKADILWQNNDGSPSVWEMNGSLVVGWGALPNPGPTWHVIGSSDVNGDGKSDILWQNDDGSPSVWLMNGTSVVGWAALPNPGSTWQLKDDGPFGTDQNGMQNSVSSSTGLGASAPSGNLAPNLNDGAVHLGAPDGLVSAPVLNASSNQVGAAMPRTLGQAA